MGAQVRKGSGRESGVKRKIKLKRFCLNTKAGLLPKSGLLTVEVR